MPLNHISCHWMIDAMSLDQTSIFFMSLDRMSFYRTIFFMSLDRTSCHWIGLQVIGLNFMPLDQTSCHWIRLHAIGSDFMLLDWTSCHWIRLHAIGSDFMPLDRTSCYGIELHAIGSDFMPLDRTSCHWIGLHVIGSCVILIGAVATSFPGSSLFLSRESTLVAAGHVSARFLQIPEMWYKGGAGKLKFVSARLPTEPSRECNL